MTTSIEKAKARGVWEGIIGFFVERKLLVLAVVAILAGSGLYVAPFDWDLGDLPRSRLPVDAIPDVGDNQQILFTEWSGRSPRDVEDQVTYPLTTALLGMPGVRSVRSFSMLGFSSVYVIFEEGVDFYWARTRVLERLSSLPVGTLPEGVSPTLGPDATALGQVYWYTLEGRDPEGRPAGGFDLDELRSIQDFTVRYALQAVPGVAEVASVGGHVREYQVDVDPEAMAAHGVSLAEVATAVRSSNLDVGARTLEINRVEYVVRGVGFIESVEDLEAAVVAARDHVPIRVGDVARVALGPAARRGALDVGGAEAVGGVVVVRHGANPLEVIERLEAQIGQLAPGLPRRTLEDGTTSQVTLVPFYDRTGLIHETLETLSTALVQQILVTIIVVLVMIRRLSSSAVISAMLPLAVLGAFVAMRLTGVDANVMSLAGIAIAIGTMVDMSIVLTENISAALDRADPAERSADVVRRAAAEVTPAVLTATATTVVSFLPVFALTDSEGRLFRPLAFTKTFALLAAALLAVVVLPAVAHLLLRRRRGRREPRRLTGLRSALRALSRPERGRDWILVAGGGALAFWLSLPAGAVVLALGLLRLGATLVPEGLARRLPWLESAAAAVAVAALLASHWSPLGQARGLWPNLLFVGGLLALVLGSFSLFQRLYPSMLLWALAHKALALSLPLALVLAGLLSWLGFDRLGGWLPQGARQSPTAEALRQSFPGLGREFMPPFDEGSFLYMPTTMPHASFGQALEMLSDMDGAIAAIPEVETVVGKLGRVDSALDPAPVSMFETVIIYRPEYGEDSSGRRVRQWRDHIRAPGDIWQEIVRAAEMPGVTSAPMLQPISTRIVMLQSGIRAPMGARIQGPDLETIEGVGQQVEALLRQVQGIRAETVFADRTVGKPYLEIDIDRQSIGRHGLTVSDVQEVIAVALGGQVLTRTVEGRERYPVRVRYMREERDSVEALGRVLVPVPATAGGEAHQVPLSELASVRYERGPQVIRSEDTFPTSYVLFDREPEVSEVAAVERAQRAIDDAIASGRLELPDGVPRPTFVGSYESHVRSEGRLKVLVPLALLLIMTLLYLQFRRPSTTLVVWSGVAVAMAGGFLLLWLYGQGWFLDFEVLGASMRELFGVGTVNLSVAVWVGFIALLGIATDDGVVIGTYLGQRFAEGDEPSTVAEVRQRVVAAAKRRVRPALMTTATTLLALLPVVTSQGRGSDVMAPMALPALGGMTIEVVTLFVVPLLYGLVEERRLRRLDAR